MTFKSLSFMQVAPQGDWQMPVLLILTTSPNPVVLTLDPSVPPPRVTPQELAITLYRVLAFLVIDMQP